MTWRRTLQVVWDDYHSATRELTSRLFDLAKDICVREAVPPPTVWILTTPLQIDMRVNGVETRNVGGLYNPHLEAILFMYNNNLESFIHECKHHIQLYSLGYRAFLRKSIAEENIPYPERSLEKDAVRYARKIFPLFQDRWIREVRPLQERVATLLDELAKTET